MKISRKDQKNSIVELSVKLDKAEWEKYEVQALKKISGEVKVDGFRKGHVPESVIRQKVGEAAIKQEALDLAISQSYVKALREEKVNPLAQPEVSIEKMDPVEFKISVQVYPKIEMKKIDISKVKISAPKVTKKEIKEQLDMFLAQSAEKKSVKRKAKKGDTAVINFDGKDEKGVSQPGMLSENHPLELGAGAFIPGFEEEVIGMKKDEEKTFPITFPKDYQSTDIAGKEFYFTVKVIDVLEKKLPKLDDEFAQKITGDKEKTVKDLEEEIKKHLTSQKKQEEYNKKQKELFDLIGKGVKADVPAIFIDEEVQGMIDNIKMQGLYSGMPWEKHLENMKKTEEELREELKKDAKKAVLSRLGLQEMIQQEKISISDEEMKAEIAKELEKVKPEEKDAKAHSFEKGHEGWAQIENRLQIRVFFEKHLGKLEE